MGWGGGAARLTGALSRCGSDAGHPPNHGRASSLMPWSLRPSGERARAGTHPLNVHAPRQPLQLREVLLVGHLLPGAGPPAILLPALHPGGDAWATRTLRGPSRLRPSSLLPRRPSDRRSAGTRVTCLDPPSPRAGRWLLRPSTRATTRGSGAQAPGPPPPPQPPAPSRPWAHTQNFPEEVHVPITAEPLGQPRTSAGFLQPPHTSATPTVWVPP